MTCRVLVTAPDGLSIEASALLDNASLASLISERLAYSLSNHQPVRVTGIGGLSHKPPLQSIAMFENWTHVLNLTLADLRFGQPGRVDLLLGADVFIEVLRDSRRKGPDNSPTAFETDLGWVLCGTTGSAPTPVHNNLSHLY